MGIPRNKMEITAAKLTRGLILTYGLVDGRGLAIDQYPARYCVSLADKWNVSFGSRASRTDYELTPRLIEITAPWDSEAGSYRTPRKIYVPGEPWRIGEKGEISARACVGEPEDKSGNADIPLCAAQPCTFTEATRSKEVNALLKFGRDSG
jgi:hypothetical protein